MKLRVRVIALSVCFVVGLAFGEVTSFAHLPWWATFFPGAVIGVYLGYRITMWAKGIG